jgi:hypothetical protein
MLSLKPLGCTALTRKKPAVAAAGFSILDCSDLAFPGRRRHADGVMMMAVMAMS